MRKFSSLSRELENKNSPIHAYVKENFPNTAALARLYKKEPSELLVPTVTPISNYRSSVLGDAFDLLVRFVADPEYYPKQALSPMLEEHLLEYGEEAASIIAENGLDPNDELPPAAAALCWYLALTTQVYRTGWIREDSPLAPFLDDCEFKDLIALAAEEDVQELQRLHKIAQQALYPLFAGLDKLSKPRDQNFPAQSFAKQTPTSLQTAP